MSGNQSSAVSWQLIILGMGVSQALIGLALILPTTGAVTLEIVVDYTGTPRVVWGLLAMVGGILVLVPQAKWLGLIVSGAWYATWTVVVGIGMFDGGPVFATAVYGLITWIHIAAAVSGSKWGSTRARTDA